MNSVNLISIDQFVAELCQIPETEFKNGVIYDFLQKHPVEKDSLTPYLFFTKKFYTRNLIFKNELFELMTLCWEIGQESRIHNHAEQNCWMTIPAGKLFIRNFKVLESNCSENFCRLSSSNEIVIGEDFPVAEVDQDEPIHQVCNLEGFNQRAVSLHIYSKPYDKCLVYTPKKNWVQEVNLFYTSIKGHLCDGIKL
jgi:cysteine dioxygenase